MADLTFRLNDVDMASSPRSHSDWVQAVRARDARIRELEELLHEAQQVASVGRVDVNLEDTKNRVEIDYLRKRKLKLETQLVRLQEEFVSITLQFDAEMNDLRARLQRGEEVISKLSSRESVGAQTSEPRRGSQSYPIASQTADARSRRRTIRSYCHLQRNERRKLCVAENVARVNIRKLQIIPRPDEMNSARCIEPRLSQSCVVTPLSRRVFPPLESPRRPALESSRRAPLESPRRGPLESPRRLIRKWEERSPSMPSLRSRIAHYRFATPVILSPPRRRFSPDSPPVRQSPFKQLRKLLR